MKYYDNIKITKCKILLKSAVTENKYRSTVSLGSVSPLHAKDRTEKGSNVSSLLKNTHTEDMSNRRQWQISRARDCVLKYGQELRFCQAFSL